MLFCIHGRSQVSLVVRSPSDVGTEKKDPEVQSRKVIVMKKPAARTPDVKRKLDFEEAQEDSAYRSFRAHKLRDALQLSPCETSCPSSAPKSASALATPTGASLAEDVSPNRFQSPTPSTLSLKPHGPKKPSAKAKCTAVKSKSKPVMKSVASKKSGKKSVTPKAKASPRKSVTPQAKASPKRKSVTPKAKAKSGKKSVTPKDKAKSGKKSVTPKAKASPTKKCVTPQRLGKKSGKAKRVLTPIVKKSGKTLKMTRECIYSRGYHNCKNNGGSKKQACPRNNGTMHM